MIPSITRLLKRSLAIESGSEIETNSATDTGTNETISTLSVIDPVTDYICPVVEKLYDADNQNIQNVSEGEYTQYVQSLLMYR